MHGEVLEQVAGACVLLSLLRASSPFPDGKFLCSPALGLCASLFLHCFGICCHLSWAL